MRRSIPVFLVATIVAFAPVAAQASPDASPDPGYLVRNALFWTQNTQRSVMDPAAGRYNFEEGLYGAARRVIQRYPEHYLDMHLDVRHEAQVAVDSLAHMRPDLPYSHAGDVGNAALMPDWNHDGVFGDSGGLNPGATGDFDADTDGVLDTAYFRTPCYTPSDQWQIHHEYASGACDTADAGAQPYRLGVASERKVIDARGLILDATLWIPMAAFSGTGCPGLGSASYGNRAAWASCVAPGNLATGAHLPSLVFSNGLASRQEHYAWLAMRMVSEGYIVLTYDPAGQGESAGTFADTLGLTDAHRLACQFAGSCRDVQDVVRWFVGQPITKVADDGPRLEPRADPSTNAPNPLLGLIDTSRVAIGGNSMGALSTLSYLNYLGSGAGADGRPLPPVAAALSLSGAQQTRAIVPIQFQTSDGDGSPLFVAPAILGVDLGANAQGIGYELIKARYDQLRTTHGAAALSLIVLEGGTHTDHVDVPFVPRTNWANALAADYAADWLNCHVLGDAAACAGAISARPHLSRGFASEQDPDGPIGPIPSRCITVPDEATINQSPQQLVAALRGAPMYDCTP
jgi:hypothetical protein